MPTTPPKPARRLRRCLAAALYLGCLAATATVVYPLVADEPAAVAGPIVAQPDDALFAPIAFTPGTWRTVEPTDAPGADWKRTAREAVGAVSLAQVDLTALPLPAGVVPQAVRVDEAGRPTAVLTKPAAAPADAAWEAAGWRVVARERQLLRVVRGDRAAVVWEIPRGSVTHLLIALTGGFDR